MFRLFNNTTKSTVNVLCGFTGALVFGCVLVCVQFGVTTTCPVHTLFNDDHNLLQKGEVTVFNFLFSVRVEFIFNGQDWRSNYPHLTRVISFGCQHWKNHSKTEMFI